MRKNTTRTIFIILIMIVSLIIILSPVYAFANDEIYTPAEIEVDDNANNTGSFDLSIALKNLMNDIYAKDISVKVKSAYETKQKKGEFLGAYAVYGYLKSSADKHKLIINEETAPIVRNIFQWKLDGMSVAAIIRKLEYLNILSPGNYLYSKGLVHHGKYAKKILWNTDTIRNILSNPVYIGHMVQGREKSGFDSGLKTKRQSPDKWIIVENTHEPIIESNIFYAVKGIIEKREEKYRDHENGLSGCRGKKDSNDSANSANSDKSNDSDNSNDSNEESGEAAYEY